LARTTPLRKDQQTTKRTGREKVLEDEQRRQEARLAEWAEADPAVREFRRRRLRKGVLADEATARRWVEGHESRARTAGVGSHKRAAGVRRRNDPRRPRVTYDDAIADMYFDTTAFAEALGDTRFRPPPARVGVVGELADVVEYLVQANPWSIGHATLFVLCARTPPVQLARVVVHGTRVKGWTRGARSMTEANDHVRVSLTVHPDLLGSDVARVLADARRTCSTSSLDFQLALFLGRYEPEHPHATVREQMVAWRKSPENVRPWRINSEGTFRAHRSKAKAILANARTGFRF
jgi:hypothetical protein